MIGTDYIILAVMEEIFAVALFAVVLGGSP